MNDKPTKGQCVLAKQLDKALGEWLIELIDTTNKSELTLEERAFAMLQAGAIIYGPDGDPRGH
jgi:hypothetical protein